MEPETSLLLDDLLWIEHSDPGGAPAGMSTNGFVLLGDAEALVVDVTFASLLPALREVAAHGSRVAGLLLSHRHLAGNGDVFNAFQAEFDAPVLLHPLDAEHPQAQAAGVEFADPLASDVPRRLGVEVLPFPGQTEGSVLLHRPADGLLVTGDSAMGTTGPQAREGVRRLVRPPEHTSTDDGQLRDGWRRFDRPVAHVVPYHGTPVVNAGAELAAIMEPLRRDPATADVTGRPVA